MSFQRKQYDIDRYYKRMQEMRDYLGDCCSRCKVTVDLEIDHIDPSLKSFTLSDKWTASWNELVPELDKCQLLCKKCHLEKTSTTHGKRRMYMRGCRCTDCKKAQSNYMRNYYNNKKN